MLDARHVAILHYSTARDSRWARPVRLIFLNAQRSHGDSRHAGPARRADSINRRR